MLLEIEEKSDEKSFCKICSMVVLLCSKLYPSDKIKVNKEKFNQQSDKIYRYQSLWC